jgi:hypothetical protein
MLIQAAQACVAWHDYNPPIRVSMDGFQAFLGGTLSVYEEGALPLLRGGERFQSDDAPRRTRDLPQMRACRCPGSPNVQVLLPEMPRTQS